MKVYVSSIRPAASGFGQYDRGEEVEADGDWDSVEEFAAHVASENRLILSYTTDPDEAEMGDEDGEQMAAKLREVAGAVAGGHDHLVAYHFGGDEIIVESVRLETDGAE